MGLMPDNIRVLGWFSFLIRECAKPYQRALTDQPLVIGGLTFKGRRSRFARKANVYAYFLDRSHDLYRDGVSDFVCVLNVATQGAVIQRLERIYSHIFIDEVQDLVGYDLDFLDLLLPPPSTSRSSVTLGSTPCPPTSGHGTRSTEALAWPTGWTSELQSAHPNRGPRAIAATSRSATSPTPSTWTCRHNVGRGEGHRR